MLEHWDAVINIYKDKKDIVSTAKITRNKETALHIAISDSKTEVVKELLDIIDPIKIREMTNDMDENPLHLAASLGQAETCRQLVEKDPELIGKRNRDGETPLFQAALHGKQKAFYALHPHCTITGKDIKHDMVHCKRTDGNSILHVAIQGEYFGLAYQIIYWYPELIKFCNENGLTALHLLAQNPSAFRSGCHLGPFDDFIYRCLIVDLDKVETPSHFKDEPSMYSDFQSAPGNYQTCLDLLNLWKHIFTVIGKDKDKKQAPEEPSQDKIAEDSSKHYECRHIDIKVGDEIKKKGEGSQEEEKDSTEQSQHPSNDNVFFHFFVKYVMEFFLLVLRLAMDQLNSNSKDDLWTTRSPVLVAGRMGLVEMVKEVLLCFPVARLDEDLDKKTVLLLAAENGQARVVDLLLKMYSREHSIYQKLDSKGDTAIHLAATFGKNRPWRISSAAIQMQWDLKWYNFIKSSMPTNLLAIRNGEGKTSMEVFEETHEGIIKDGVKWLNSTSQSCSVIAALIASVAYASAATVPGGDNQNNGIPILKGDPSFDIFIIASLAALCFSVTSLTMFLSVLTSNYMIEDFLYNLPTKLLLGLTTLFISIGAMLVSFCAGHFFNIGDRNRNAGSPVFAIICLPVSAYVLTQFRLLISLVKPPF
ncbi:serine/threonine-protein phosphatase 6 regulatory ankyrin repeat subunit B-like protein [Cinnamomum micranthum f. kanehirae]|uniref:Serine/threonine-protein phosphatase 6 regulatory ankyrin repeat subunit B-like protein n=1 Tax=Cinnamomum micranthum f. kanehirae TaxID=337451 RepID=A0A443NAV4_9MAGN|nr:serine/threonine-protein phosphatase 6 regulatory ankyrin repeat subunit B-like protein [Cinnamomum micranthum f. kanehirae]